MWFELDASGIKIKLRIKGYRPSTKKNWDSTWCSCDFLFSSGINYNIKMHIFSKIKMYSFSNN